MKPNRVFILRYIQMFENYFSFIYVLCNLSVLKIKFLHSLLRSQQKKLIKKHIFIFIKSTKLPNK